MNYIFHPIIVHFPIALLFIYSAVKILPLKRYFPSVAWKDIERILLVIGVLGAYAASTTGETAEHILRPNRDLVEMHSLFASTAIWLYSLLLAGEVLDFLNFRLIQKIKKEPIKKLLIFIKDVLTHRIFSRILALVALGALFLTGLLGGVLVHGVSADPLAPIVLKILNITL